MDRRTVLLGSLGLAIPSASAFAQEPSGQQKSLRVVPTSGELAGKVLYTNSYALLIGISKYPFLPATKQLAYARKDAEDVRDVLVKSFGFPAANVKVLLDADATKANIEAELDALSGAKPTDRVLVFFSGHGHTVNKTGLLVPSDADIKLDDNKTTAGVIPKCLLMDNLTTYLKQVQAKHKLIIADACFSGLIQSTRSLGGLSGPALEKLAGENAFQALTASGKAEVSKESDTLKNGIFTRRFLDVLDELSKRPGDVMTIRQIADQVAKRVLNDTKGEQNPLFADLDGSEGQFLFVNVDPTANPTLATGKGKVRKTDVSAKLRITGAPTGATVKVDGKDIVGGQFETDLVDDESRVVTVFVKADGYLPLSQDATLRRGSSTDVSITLNKIPEGRLVLENVPDKAVVKVDGVVKTDRELVFDMKNVDEKSVKLVITADGYRAEVVDIELEKGATVRYRAEAKRVDGATPVVERDNVQSRNNNARLSGRLSDYPALRAYIEGLRSIPAGTFEMGSTSGEADENPKYTVRLSAFRIGATPVTVAVWKEFCAATGTTLPEVPSWGLLANHPVVNVSWNDIMGMDGDGGFCAWASDIAGFRLTLPTEAQFEYAARGGQIGLEFPWGNAFDPSNLWSSLNFGDVRKTAPVVRTSNIFLNAFGLTDMSGNVWQWCSDMYGPYSSVAQSDPVGPSSTKSDARCVRGGSWYGARPDFFRCAYRLRYGPDIKNDIIGFRLSAGEN